MRHNSAFIKLIMKGQLSIFNTFLLKKNVEVRGLMDYTYCPQCNRPVDEYQEECSNCGQMIAWDVYKSIYDNADI